MEYVSPQISSSYYLEISVKLIVASSWVARQVLAARAAYSGLASSLGSHPSRYRKASRHTSDMKIFLLCTIRAMSVLASPAAGLVGMVVPSDMVVLLHTTNYCIANRDVEDAVAAVGTAVVGTFQSMVATRVVTLVLELVNASSEGSSEAGS